MLSDAELMAIRGRLAEFRDKHGDESFAFDCCGCAEYFQLPEFIDALLEEIAAIRSGNDPEVMP